MINKYAIYLIMFFARLMILIEMTIDSIFIAKILKKRHYIF